MDVEKAKEHLIERQNFLKERLMNKFEFMDTFGKFLSPSEKKEIKSDIKALKKKLLDIKYQFLHLDLHHEIININ